MCDYCYAVHRREMMLRKHLQPKPKIRKISTRQSVKMSDDRKLWDEIWAERLHFCENIYCRKSLEPYKTAAGKPISHLFSHRRTKAAAPGLRYEKANIDLLCPDCHSEWETGDRSKVKIVPFILPEKKYAINMLMASLRQHRGNQGCCDLRPQQHEPSL